MKSLKPLIVALLVGTGLPGLVSCAATDNRKSAGEELDDTGITTRVKAAFVKDSQVSALQVDVNTYRGVVQLSGFVDSEAVARRAVELAREVPGVRSVKNDLRIKPRS